LIFEPSVVIIGLAAFSEVFNTISLAVNRISFGSVYSINLFSVHLNKIFNLQQIQHLYIHKISCHSPNIKNCTYTPNDDSDSLIGTELALEGIYIPAPSLILNKDLVLVPLAKNSI